MAYERRQHAHSLDSSASFAQSETALSWVIAILRTRIRKKCTRGRWVRLMQRACGNWARSLLAKSSSIREASWANFSNWQLIDWKNYFNLWISLSRSHNNCFCWLVGGFVCNGKSAQMWGSKWLILSSLRSTDVCKEGDIYKSVTAAAYSEARRVAISDVQQNRRRWPVRRIASDDEAFRPRGIAYIAPIRGLFEHK